MSSSTLGSTWSGEALSEPSLAMQYTPRGEPLRRAVSAHAIDKAAKDRQVRRTRSTLAVPRRAIFASAFSASITVTMPDIESDSVSSWSSSSSSSQGLPLGLLPLPRPSRASSRGGPGGASSLSTTTGDTSVGDVSLRATGSFRAALRRHRRRVEARRVRRAATHRDFSESVLSPRLLLRSPRRSVRVLPLSRVLGQTFHASLVPATEVQSARERDATPHLSIPRRVIQACCDDVDVLLEASAELPHELREALVALGRDLAGPVALADAPRLRCHIEMLFEQHFNAQAELPRRLQRTLVSLLVQTSLIKRIANRQARHTDAVAGHIRRSASGTLPVSPATLKSFRSFSFDILPHEDAHTEFLGHLLVPGAPAPAGSQPSTGSDTSTASHVPSPLSLPPLNTQRVLLSHGPATCRLCHATIAHADASSHLADCIASSPGLALCTAANADIAAGVVATEAVIEDAAPADADALHALVETLLRAKRVHVLESGPRAVVICELLLQQLQTAQRRASHNNLLVHWTAHAEALVQAKLAAMLSTTPRPATPEPATPVSPAPRALPDAPDREYEYEIVRQISAGAYGRVFLVRELGGERRVRAMKVISLGDCDEEQRQQVADEAAILTMLEPPYAVTMVHGYFDPHLQTQNLVMDLLPGGDLSSLLDAFHYLPLEHTRWVTAEIVQCLMDIHRRGVIHRDLKPENLLFDAQGHVVVADFGLSVVWDAAKRCAAHPLDRVAALMAADMLESGRSSVAGTPDYLAPEIILGLNYDHSVDYWALGCIVFEMATGVPPFNDSTPREIFARALEGEIEWPLDDDGTHILPEILRSFVSGLLNADALQRRAFIAGILDHPFLASFDLTSIRDAPSPHFVPVLEDDEDLSYFL